MLLFAFFWISQLVPDAANVDFKQPQITASQNLVALTFGGSSAVYFSASRDQGRTFSRPVKVGEAGVLALGRHRGPRIAITSRAIVISAIVGEQGKGKDGDLVSWRSTDGGRTWLKGPVINDRPNAAREGLHGMAAGPDGLLYAVWLDDRAGGKEVYGAYSDDGGATWSKNVRIYHSPDGHVCECCHPSVLVGNGGKVYVMWRNWLGGSRDFYVARSDDGGRTFQEAEKLGVGTWKLNACPMDGGGLALTREGTLVSVWRRQDQIFLTKGEGAETRIDAGKDPALAIGREGLYLVWTNPSGVYARVPGKTEPVALDAEGGYAQLAALPGGQIAAVWESKGAIRFETLR